MADPDFRETIEHEIKIGPNGQPCLVITFQDEFHIGLYQPDDLRHWCAVLLICADELETAQIAQAN